MEFTQIQEISSLLQRLSYSNNIEKEVFRSYTNSYDLSSQQLVDEPLYNEFMKNLDELNSEIPLSRNQTNDESQNLLQLGAKREFQQSKTFQQDFQSSQPHRKYDKTNSIIFKSSLCNSRAVTDPKLDTNLIKVFFFNSPIMKMIPYNKKTTIKQLIERSLDTYLIQNTDTIRATQPIQKFQMRLPLAQNDFCPDMNIQPIHIDRVLSENMFETLVLVEKSKKDLGFESKPTKEYSFDQSNLSFSSSMPKDQLNSNQVIKIALMDETYFELVRVQLSKEGNLQKLFQVIKDNDLHNGKQFVIKEDPDSEFDLMPDHQVKFIQKNRLYLVIKKYLDQAQDQIPGPIRLKSLIPQQINYLPPIGINEASRYEEFEVTKISSIGIAIDRILGIDQLKIYNYQKQLRQNKRQATFVDRFLGFNNQTGTKRPFRLIKDIKEIKKFQGGIQIVYPEKITTFIIKNDAILERIVRKLTFLHELNLKNPERFTVNTSQTNDSPKKGSFFFKF